MIIWNQHRTKLDPLDMGDSCMPGTDCGAPGSGTKINPYCLYLLFGTHSLRMHTLFYIDILGRALLLSSLKSGWGKMGEGGRKGGREGVGTGIGI